MRQTNPHESPFHEGEKAIQSMLGLRERIEGQGQRGIRDHMTEQHQEFVVHLPFLVAGSVDSTGRPWASVLAGDPGFARPIHASRLRVETRVWEQDPIHDGIRLGNDIGLLGIDLTNRRRNRFTGHISLMDDTGFEVDVVQTAGACPKYIQMRRYAVSEPAMPSRSEPMSHLQGHAAEMVRRSDVFFMASAYGSSHDAANLGADVAHRGGKKGFVRLNQAGTELSYPEFRGNNQFNTLGNILKNPRVGLVFPDFDTNRALTLTGTARTQWEGREVDAFEGALRMVHITVQEAYLLEGIYPFRMTFDKDEISNLKTGSWETVAQIL